MKDGKEIEYNKWDEALRNYGPVKQTTCGENRYIGVKNVLEFYITAGCELNIAPRDAIQTMVRMEWTVDEFFNNGGTTTFVDNLAGSLGIHASTIKVVSVYEGSLAVNYELSASKEEPLKLEEIQALQTQKFATGKVNVGAPILDVVVTAPPPKKGAAPVEAESIVADGKVTAVGFEPITITVTSTNTLNNFLWTVVDTTLIATPSQIFSNFLKETMQFLLRRGFKQGFVSLDEGQVNTDDDFVETYGEGSVVEL